MLKAGTYAQAKDDAYSSNVSKSAVAKDIYGSEACNRPTSMRDLSLSIAHVSTRRVNEVDSFAPHVLDVFYLFVRVHPATAAKTYLCCVWRSKLLNVELRQKPFR